MSSQCNHRINGTTTMAEAAYTSLSPSVAQDTMSHSKQYAGPVPDMLEASYIFLQERLVLGKAMWLLGQQCCVYSATAQKASVLGGLGCQLIFKPNAPPPASRFSTVPTRWCASSDTPLGIHRKKSNYHHHTTVLRIASDDCNLAY